MRRPALWSRRLPISFNRMTVSIRAWTDDRFVRSKSFNRLRGSAPRGERFAHAALAIPGLLFLVRWVVVHTET